MGEDWKPAPVAANASAEQWATDLPDGSVSFDAYAGWSRDQLKDRCLELIGRIEQLEEAANASAEARLREALQFYADEWQGNMEGDSETPGLSRCWREPTESLFRDEGNRARIALSTHPHASDCDDKTTYDVLGDQRMCVGVPASGIAKLMDAIENPPQPNEALKKLMRSHASDCDKQGETTKIKVPLPEWLGPDTPENRERLQAFVKGSPSDRTADVTGYLPIHECYETGDDEVTVVELKTFLDKKWPAPHGDVARALLDAFTVGRR
jgi:hypothetical protein